jgi:hypothetical protein
MKSEEIIIESIKNKKLRESTYKDLYHRMTLLEKSFNKDVTIGNDYIPVPIFIIGDHLDTFNKNNRKNTGEFCKLINITKDTFEFLTKSDEVIEWPNSKQIGVSYMTTLMARDINDYNKIRTMLSLIFNLTIPLPKEE